MTDEEVWRDIKGYEGLYQASNLGNVRNAKTKRILKQAKDKCNYCIVSLSKQSKHKTITVHTLVAKTFIIKPNQNQKLQVNHKDGNKSNNNANNLEWITPSQNLKHAYKNGLKRINDWQKKFIANQGRKLSKKTIQYDLNGIFIKEWNCVRDIERELKISNESISHCCTGKTKTAGGYKWKYKIEAGV